MVSVSWYEEIILNHSVLLHMASSRFVRAVTVILPRIKDNQSGDLPFASTVLSPRQFVSFHGLSSSRAISSIIEWTTITRSSSGRLYQLEHHTQSQPLSPDLHQANFTSPSTIELITNLRSSPAIIKPITKTQSSPGQLDQSEHYRDDH